MIRRLYLKTLQLAERPDAARWLALVSFAESSVFPIPPDALLLPMVLARRQAAFRLAALCTLASVAGAVTGYLIGAFLWDMIGELVIAFYGYEAAFARFQARFDAWSAAAVLIGGLTPVPFKVITLASGVAGTNLIVFILFSLIARGLRFFLEASLLWYYGEPIRRFVETRLVLLVALATFALVGGFVLVKLL